MSILIRLLVMFVLFLPSLASSLSVGIGKADITPPIGTPSAGYQSRKGEGMIGIHDPLLAISLFIDNGTQKIVLCSVDHLGFTYEMVQEIVYKIGQNESLQDCEVFLGSSHTHSGGGAYLNIPFIGEFLSGKYDPSIRQFYIDQTAYAIIESYENRKAAKIGIGYGRVPGLSHYRGVWPEEMIPLDCLTVIKITDLEDLPLAVWFNYPLHPTILRGNNRLFSSDFVGYAREHLQSLIGDKIQPIYFNGAQGDIIPNVLPEDDPFISCDFVARSLAENVKNIWDQIETQEELDIAIEKQAYEFSPQPTPQGLLLPVERYKSELNLLVLNHTHAFLTIPGELSCFYDERLKEFGRFCGYEAVSILGLTNDAHGYIIAPESWRQRSFESNLSFGGESYGDWMEETGERLLENRAPDTLDSANGEMYPSASHF